MRARSVVDAVFNKGGFELLRDYFAYKLGHMKKAPSSVNVVPFPWCNEECEICYWERYLRFKKLDKGCLKLLSAEEWEEIFRNYKKRGTGSLVITGGEPTLYPEVIDAGWRVFGNGLIVITNGRIKVNPKWLNRFFVSIHSASSELHDEMCGVQGAFKEIIENIRGDKRFVISVVLNHKNINEIMPMIKLARELGIPIVFSGYTPGRKKSDQEPDDPLTLTKSDLKFIVKELLEAWKDNKDILFMNPEIIKLFWTGRHQKGCSLRGGKQGGGWVDSRDFLNRRIDQCVMGENSDCSKCQCIIPKYMQNLKEAIPRAIGSFNLRIIVDAVNATKVFTYEEEK